MRKADWPKPREGGYLRGEGHPAATWANGRTLWGHLSRPAALLALLTITYCLWEFSQGNGPRDDWRSPVKEGLK